VTTTATHNPPGAEGDRAAEGPTFEINIEGRVYEWHERTITTAQIRELGGLPADQPVIEINFQDNTERTLAEGDVVEVKPGHGFGKKIGFKRGDR
jgi:predicted molibdopterin-dependent oxidoreductase YjgC